MKFLADLGLSRHDVFLLWGCPVFASLGSFVHAAMIHYDFSQAAKARNRQDSFYREQQLSEVIWVVYRMLVGAVLGLVLSLYFLGSLTDGITTISRILALSVFVGYAAPKVWIKQEQAVESMIDRKMSEFLEKEQGKKAPGSSVHTQQPNKPVGGDT